MIAVFRVLSLVMLFGFGLVACGDDDSESASAPAESASAPAESASAPAESAAAPAESTAAPAAMPEDSSEKSMGSSMEMEKAEGVIYQDEIYANWPYN